MNYWQIRPGPAVSGFIDCLWILEDDSGAIQRIVPDGYPALILNLLRPFESFQQGRWKTQPSCFLAGQTTGPLLLRSNGPAQILGVALLPDGASQLLGLPIEELTDLICPIDELSPALSRELERVREPAPLLDRVARLEGVLQRHAVEAGVQDRLVSTAVGRIIHGGGMSDVGSLAIQLGVSLRQLERRFRSRVGLGPKLFSRIQRFQRVFQAMERDRYGWVDAAVECGYYDQAHLIRDFRNFSGEAPAALLAEADLARHFLRCEIVSRSSKTGARVSL